MNLNLYIVEDSLLIQNRLLQFIQDLPDVHVVGIAGDIGTAYQGIFATDTNAMILDVQLSDGNGKVLFSGLKRKGDTLDQGGKPPLTLRLGFARGAQVAYNGQPVDVAPFTSGETARLKLGQ